MKRALELAARADHRVSPNPMVGSVVLDERGDLAGEGFHERYGGPHAEVNALRAAGERARGGTAYVSLEPHGFHSAHSEPCTVALIQAGVRHVVVAMEDPDPRVRGDGVAQLRTAGIEVTEGVLEPEARRLNRFYVKHRETGRPFVTLKWAMSLDGVTSTGPGQPRWITGAPARRHVHRLRHEHDAIVVGVNTILADDPQLTTRLEDLPDARNPVRVVLDRRLRTPAGAKVLPALVFTKPDHDPADAPARAELIPIGTDPETVLDELGRRQLLSVLVEGGAQVLASFAPFADAVAAYVAPSLLGGGSAVSLDAPGVTALGDDILIEADVHRDR